MMYRAFALLLLSASTLAQTRPTTAPALQAAAERAARAAELTQEFRSYPSLGQKTWPDVLRLEYEGQSLMARSTLEDSDTPRSFTIPGVDGYLSGWLRLNKQRQPLMLRIERLRTKDPVATYVHTSLHAVPGHIILSRDSEGPSGSLSIQFLDDRQFPDPTSKNPEGESRLYVNASDIEDRELVKVSIITADVRTMVREHRHDVNLYLRPALRELNQEYLLNPPAALVQQVLGAGVPDGELTDEMKKLVAQLDADDFPKRQAAVTALKKLGEPAARALAHLDRDKLSPEQIARVDEITAAAQATSTEDATALSHDRAFLIDCLRLPEEKLRALAKQHLETETGKKIDFDPAATDAKRNEQIDALDKLLLGSTTQPVR